MTKADAMFAGSMPSLYATKAAAARIGTRFGNGPVDGMIRAYVVAAC